MVRTQIQLKEAQYAMLKRLAREEGISMAEVIRQAIDYFEARQTRLSDAEMRESAKKAVGMFHSDVGDVSRRHDDYFADSILP